MKNIFSNIKKWYQNLPDKKKYLELVSAALTVPMLLTVIVINLNNINNQKNNSSTVSSPTTTPIEIIITGSQQEDKTPPEKITNNPTTTTISPTITPTPIPSTTSCIQEIGPIEIISPQEGEIITGNSVCINISTDPKYCSLLWSYKLDDSDWSDFSNNNICLYNLDNGKKQLQIKFKNISNDETITLERNFTYQNSALTLTPTITPTLSPTPTSTP